MKYTHVYTAEKWGCAPYLIHEEKFEDLRAELEEKGENVDGFTLDEAFTSVSEEYGSAFEGKEAVQLTFNEKGNYTLHAAHMAVFKPVYEGVKLVAIFILEGPKYPEIVVPLVGQDGNPMAIVGRTLAAMRSAGVSDEERKKYQEEALSGDYNNVLNTTMRWVNTD